jgi:hypothetical protein
LHRDGIKGVMHHHGQSCQPVGFFKGDFDAFEFADVAKGPLTNNLCKSA